MAKLIVLPRTENDVQNSENIMHEVHHEEEVVTTPTKLSQSTKLYMCNICSFTTKHRSSLSRHYNIHNNKTVKCAQCNSRFQDKSALRVHLKGHAGEIGCSSCGKKFMSLQGVREHEQYHCKPNSKPFCCNLCGKGFTRLGHLKDHENAIHTKNKPYVCDKCSKGFSLRSTYKGHIDKCKGHAHTCNVCMKKLATRWALREHKIAKHTKPIKCSCGKEYQWRPSFDRHVKRTGHRRCQ